MATMNKFQRTHQVIINRGMALFMEKGFDQVSVVDICKDTSIARPTFYLHFKSKEQLVAEYYESNMFFSEEMATWVRDTWNTWDSIIRTMLLVIQHTCNNEQVDLISRYVSYRLTNGNSDEASAFNNDMEALLMVLIREAQKEKVIQNNADPYYLCQTISMLQMGNLLKWCSNQGSFDQFVSFFWNLEAVLNVHEQYKGRWKLPENNLYY